MVPRLACLQPPAYCLLDFAELIYDVLDDGFSKNRSRSPAARRA